MRRHPASSRSRNAISCARACVHRSGRSILAGTAIAQSHDNLPGATAIHLVLLSIVPLLVSEPARGDEPARVDGRLERELDMRVGAALDRSAERAAERASAALEAREAERLDDVAYAAARCVERQLARFQTRGEWYGRVEAELARAR